jgi:hypothetical protein
MDNQDTLHTSLPMPQLIRLHSHDKYFLPTKAPNRISFCLEWTNKMNNSNPLDPKPGFDITGLRLTASG